MTSVTTRGPLLATPALMSAKHAPVGCRLPSRYPELLGCCLAASLAVLPACNDRHAGSSMTTADDPARPGASASAAATTYADASIPDEKLRSALEEAMARDAVLQGLPIHVTVGNGNVVLFGSVPTLAAKWRATRLVGNFKGALTLTDGIQVSAPARPDAELARDVNGAIQGDAATRHTNVRATASADTVTLAGAADSYAQRELVADIASHVRGVRDLKLAIAIAPAAPRADGEIATNVTSDLLEDARLDGPRITVAVHGGVVSLSGVVGSLAQREAAAGDAMRGGATSVDANALRIDWRESTRARAMARQPLPADEQISAAVTRALADDVRVGVEVPLVSVEGGVVTLSGKVEDFRAGRAAVRDARLVSGVSRVDDTITVEAAKSQSDVTIQKQVLAGIYGDVAAADSQDVRVTTTMAKVTLRGTVATRKDKAVIEDDVEEVPGVVAVDNELQVRGNDAFITPVALRRGVTEGIFWDPRIASPDPISVDASAEGDVTLTGHVGSWQEVRAAGDDAVAAGAAHVINNIQIATDAVPRIARK